MENNNEELPKVVTVTLDERKWLVMNCLIMFAIAGLNTDLKQVILARAQLGLYKITQAEVNALTDEMNKLGQVAFGFEVAKI